MKIGIVSSLSASLCNFRGPLIKEMVRRGHTVYAFAPDYDTSTRTWLESNDVIVIDYSLSRTGLNPIKDIHSIIELWLKIRSLKLDLTFCYYIKPVIYGTIAAAISGVKARFAMIEGLGYSFTNDHRPAFKKRMLRLIASLLYKMSLSICKGVIFLNSDDYTEFRRGGILRHDRVSVLGGIGVDLSEWKYSGSVQDPMTFIMIGRLLADKGVREFVSAASFVKSRYPEARFVLLGDLDENPSAVSLSEVQSWVDSKIIEWPGHVSVGQWLENASVFVLPSYREGVPRSTQEAMARGLPVITTDVPGCRETVNHGVNGFLVPHRDADSLANAMIFFLEKPELCQAMGFQSRKIAEEKFDVRIQNNKLLEYMNIS